MTIINPSSSWVARHPNLSRVAVFRALKLGDLLCAVPAFRALRAGLPDAEITLIGLPWARGFADRLAVYIDDFVEFPGYPGLPEQPFEPAAWPPFVEKIRSRRYDLIVQMHGSGQVSNSIIEQLGACWTAGLYDSTSSAPDPTSFVPYGDVEPEPLRYLRLLTHLGFSDRGPDLEFPLSDHDHSLFQALAAQHGIQPERLACVHPGASVEHRRWSSEGFTAVADGLAERGFQVALTGSAEETGLTRAISHRMRHPAVDLAGLTSLGALAALLSRARLLICNDTGASHLAAATRTPSVVVCPVSDPRVWAPLDRTLHRVVDARQGATPSDVLAAVDLLGVRPRA